MNKLSKLVVGLSIFVIGSALFFGNGEISGWLSQSQCQNFDVRSCEIFTYNEIAIIVGFILLIAGLTVLISYRTDWNTEKQERVADQGATPQ